VGSLARQAAEIDLDGFSSTCLNNSPMPAAKADQRRAAGLRTRTRLLDAALDMLAERGEDGVTLRELTDAAEANVAAVSYHFGALKSLCDAAIEQALEQYLDAQEQAVTTLGPDSSLEALAAAFAAPMIRALTVGGRDLAVIRLVARAGIDPPREWDRFDARFERVRSAVVRVLRANVRGVTDRELALRTRCAAGMLNWLALAPISSELQNMSERQLERLLVPVIAGALRGTTDCSLADTGEAT
jgi:AcrR family transcriptional regulator